MGIHLGDFGSNPVDRGVPVSVYGFLQLPLLRITETTDLFTSFGLGVAHGWNTPTFEEFPFERHPTSPMTSYLDLGLYGRQRLSVRVDLLGGFSMNHFSNGGAHNPNRGLTVKAPRVALQYSLGDRGPRRRRSGLAPFTERWVTRVDGGFAVKGVGFVWTGESFTPRGSIAIGTFKGSVWRRYYRNGQVGGGLEVSYESGRQPREAASPEADLRGGASLAAFTGYEQLFGRVSIYVQVGAHLTRTRRDERPATFQRVGFIQRFSERWFADVGFRFFNSGKDFSHDFIAWHLGYQL